MSKWQVDAIGKNKAAVTTPRARYVLQANATSFALEAFRGEQPVEVVRIKHVGNKYWLEGVDSAGRAERRTMHIRGKRVISQGVIGGSRFSVDSSVCNHIGLLVAKLHTRKPLRLPLISVFLKTFKADSRLRSQLQRHVDMAMLLRSPDAVVIACIIICAECALTDGLIACLACALCMKPPT
jgi:hypothetical protein